MDIEVGIIIKEYLKTQDVDETLNRLYTLYDRRKAEIEKKPKRKYTRKPKENNNV